MEEIETTTSINLKLESSETLETTEKAEITTFINDKLTISKPKLLILKHMKTKIVGRTQQIHQEDIKGLVTILILIATTSTNLAKPIIPLSDQ